MNRIIVCAATLALAAAMPLKALAQEAAPADTSTAVITLEQALQIALSENETVKIADMEIERTGYAKKGTYASLLPQVDLTGSYMRTIKKQVMYMDMDMSSFFGGSESTGSTGSTGTTEESSSSKGSGIEVGRDNTYSGGLTASMPLINFQLWKSLKISGQEVDLAVEKARSSRLDMVSQVKQAYFGVLFAKEALNVYKSVYENAVENFQKTESRYNAQKASELEYTRAKTNVAAAIPDVYNAEASVILALWQLKAVMGVNLEKNIDIAGSLSDYAGTMLRDIADNSEVNLEYNTTMRQLSIQAEELANNVRLKQYAYLPTLAATFSYTANAMTNDFKFSEYQWTPYSYVGLSLTIPIFSGGKRYNDVRQARVQKTELELTMKDTERKLRIAIRQYLNTMEANMKSYNAALETVALAQKAYDISAKSYQVGKSTITDLNDAQLALTQAKLAESQAVYNFLVAKTGLEQTIGFDFVEK